MNKIQVLRSIIDNGWTISNRRYITNMLHHLDSDVISKFIQKLKLDDDVFQGNKFIEYLASNRAGQTERLLIDSLQKQSCLLESKTFSKLFSPEFAPLRKLTEEGYPVTTVIDKSTGKPVEVYFKKSPSATVGRLPNNNPFESKVYVPLEEWTMYRRMPDGSEEKLGFIKWTIQKDKNKFGFGFIGQETEYLKHYTGALPEDNECLYSGIGIRLNQLKIERFLQEKLGQLEICSSGTAYPFHAKNGFKVVYEEKTFPLSVDNFIQKLENISGLDSSTIKPIIEKYVIRKDNNSVTITSKFLDEICPLAYIKTGERRFGDISMELPKEGLDFWKSLINLQPIF